MTFHYEKSPRKRGILSNLMPPVIINGEGGVMQQEVNCLQKNRTSNATEIY